MQKSLKEILDILVKAQGIDCLHKSETWRYVTDLAPKADNSYKKIIILAFQSKAFNNFFSSDDFDQVFRQLKQETHWDDQTLNDVINSFAEELGIDNRNFFIGEKTENAFHRVNSVSENNQSIHTVKKTDALTGIFSVSKNKKVFFSKGALYWDGSSFKMEENQYDFRTWYKAPSVINGVYKKKILIFPKVKLDCSIGTRIKLRFTQRIMTDTKVFSTSLHMQMVEQ